MRGSEIVLSVPPKGHFEEGIITDTSKPGMFVEAVPTVGDIGGRGKFRATSRSAGAKGPIAILLPDSFQGQPATQAYVANTRCFVYYPLPGEELNALLGDISGTGDTLAVGDLLGIAAGKLHRDSSYASLPFEAREALPALTADTLVFVRMLGGLA